MSRILRTLLIPAYHLYESRLEKEVREQPPPKHVGVILDGNRRYAIQWHLASIRIGHEIGARKAKDFLKWCIHLGIKNMSLFAFSTENFRRPMEEVRQVLEIIREKFYELAEDSIVHTNKVKIRALGRLDMLPRDLLDAISKAVEATENYSKFTLNIAVAYGGRAELLDAISKIARKSQNGKLSCNEITEETIGENLYLPDLPPLDIVLRTSGESRLSNFMLWQSCGSYVVIIDVYWPEIRKIDLLRTIRTYQRRLAATRKHPVNEVSGLGGEEALMIPIEKLIIY